MVCLINMCFDELFLAAVGIFLCARSDCADPCAIAEYCSLISSFQHHHHNRPRTIFWQQCNIVVYFMLRKLLKWVYNKRHSRYHCLFILAMLFYRPRNVLASQSKNYWWAASAELRRCVVGLLRSYRLNPVSVSCCCIRTVVYRVWVIIWSDTHLCYALQHLCCADIRQLFRNRALRSSGCCVRHQIWPMKHAEPSVRILKPGVILCCTRNVDWHYWLDWIPKRKCFTFIYPSSF